MKKTFYAWVVAFASVFANVHVLALSPENVKIDGYVGDKINLCIEKRVKAQNVEELVAPFRRNDDHGSWQTEFLGKWMLGAIDSYRYCGDKELLEMIKYGAEGLIAAQKEDGYIGSYDPASRLEQWDIWGRKYTALALIAYYRLTGDARALTAVEKSIQCLMKELADRNLDIARTGNYFGMASCSILEPVVYLYGATDDERYLDFAKSIVQGIEREGSSQLVTKAMNGVPVSARSKFPEQWWSFENGQKAYEMMSCYEGLVELGKITGNDSYVEAARRTIENIIEDEINVAGSGAAFECWYNGRARQTIPTYHMMETCVTFTWMQFCARMLDATHNAMYADQFERTMYNALMGSMKNDGSQISKYSPLEGHRFQGEDQCGMHINCCNANGPRGFALIPSTAYTVDGSNVFVNLYIPSNANFRLGKNDVSLKMQTSYPVDGTATMSVNPKKSATFVIALRIPEGNEAGYEVKVNGSRQEGAEVKDGYLYVDRKWKAGDVVEVTIPLVTKVVEMDNAQAIVRGPVLFARDSRYGDGYVDESAVVTCNSDKIVNAAPVEVYGGSSFEWLSMQVPMVVGANLEDEADKAEKMIRFCDYGSAGNDWNKSGRYRVWIPKTLHVMSQPYHKY